MPTGFFRFGLSIAFFSLFLLSTTTAIGASLQEAEKLASSGSHTAAEAVYDRLLEENPDDLSARLGRAHVRSWQGHHPAAQADFKTILNTHPNHVDALTGLGFSLAWEGRHEEADIRFQESLRLDSSRIDTRKGFAFTALWRGNAEEAIRRFQNATQSAPNDSEALVGLGQAFLLAGKKKEARTAFQEALRVEPGRMDAIEGLKSVPVHAAPLKLEFGVWVGHTSNGGGTGLRTAEIAVWPKKDLRLWVRYDNALSLDNPALVREGKKIPTVFLGTLSNWGKQYTTRLELGRRNLVGDINQNLILGEQVVYLPRTHTVKIGGLLARREDSRTDWNIYAGFGLPLHSQLRTEPTIYYTKTGGLDENEWRFLLPLEYRYPGGWQVGVHLALGNLKSEIPQASGDLWAISTLLSIPISSTRQGYLLVKHEEPPNNESFTIISLGLTFALERK